MILHDIAVAYRNFMHLRHAIMPIGAPSDPALSILVELFINVDNRRCLSVGDVALLTGIASTTSLRWIRQLEHHGLVHRQSDPADQRRIFLSLTPDGHALAEQVLRSLAEQFAPLRNAFAAGRGLRRSAR